MSKEGETAGEAYVRALGDLVNQGGAGGAPSAEQVMGFYKTEASKVGRRNIPIYLSTWYF